MSDDPIQAQAERLALEIYELACSEDACKIPCPAPERMTGLLAAALRRQREEAPQSYEGAGCGKHDRYWTSIYGNCMACARDEAYARGRADGARDEREACALLHENIENHCDRHRDTKQCCEAMGAIIRYRDAIRARASGEKPK